MIGRGQHPLHHVLIRAVCRHGQQRRSNERGQNGVWLFQHRFQRRPEWQFRVPAGLKKFYVGPTAEICFHGIESARDVSHQQKNREDD